MRTKTGKEMRKLMFAVSATTLLLVLAIVAYFLADIIATTNNNIERNKQLVIDQAAKSLTELSESLNAMLSNPATIDLFNQDFVNEIIMTKNIDLIYGLTGRVAMGFFPIDYMSVIRGGEIVYHDAKSGYDINRDEMPKQPPEGDYQILDSLGGKEGFYASAFFPMDLGIVGINETLYLNMIIDRTAEYKAVEDYFVNQRDDLILRLSIAAGVAIILSLLLTTFGLRFFTRKYVVKPIEELNRTAEEIASGSFQGEVKVDGESAYAALQGLLRSGQKVLRRFDQELGDQGSRPSP